MKKYVKKITLLVVSLLVLVGCSLPSLPGLGGGIGQETIRVGGMSTTESQIIASIVQQLIEEETDYNVELVSNLGTAVVGNQALVNGDIDVLSITYTGTDLVAVFGLPPVKDPAEAMEIVRRKSLEEFDQIYFDSYGFDNTYVFLVTRELAEEYGLETISDVEPIASQLNAGFDSQWLIREGDGYQGFIEEYGFEFGETYPMQIGLVYSAVATGDMDVVLGYSTDGRIPSYDLVSLEDNRQFFPPYDAAPKMNSYVLEEYPGVAELLQRLEGEITTEMMQQMNYRADHELVEPSRVATEFLEANNYFREEAE